MFIMGNNISTLFCTVLMGSLHGALKTLPCTVSSDFLASLLTLHCEHKEAFHWSYPSPPVSTLCHAIFNSCAITTRGFIYSHRGIVSFFVALLCTSAISSCY